jgi:hypothetical protein
MVNVVPEDTGTKVSADTAEPPLTEVDVAKTSTTAVNAIVAADTRDQRRLTMEHPGRVRLVVGGYMKVVRWAVFGHLAPLRTD